MEGYIVTPWLDDEGDGWPRPRSDRKNSGTDGTFSGEWATLREGSNLGAGPFDFLEGSGFRVNFKRPSSILALEQAPSRTNLAAPFLRSRFNPQCFKGLPPLVYPELRRAISCLSFFDRDLLFSIACSLFSQNAGGGVSPANLRYTWGTSSTSLRSSLSISFRINTCKSVSKQTTLTSFRITTYEKPRGGRGYC